MNRAALIAHWKAEQLKRGDPERQLLTLAAQSGHQAMHEAACPHCQAEPGQPCFYTTGRAQQRMKDRVLRKAPHQSRVNKWQKTGSAPS